MRGSVDEFNEKQRKEAIVVASELLNSLNNLIESNDALMRWLPGSSPAINNFIDASFEKNVRILKTVQQRLSAILKSKSVTIKDLSEVSLSYKKEFDHQIYPALKTSITWFIRRCEEHIEQTKKDKSLREKYRVLEATASSFFAALETVFKRFSKLNQYTI